jgi:hypothetical protein
MADLLTKQGISTPSWLLWLHGSMAPSPHRFIAPHCLSPIRHMQARVDLGSENCDSRDDDWSQTQVTHA